MARIPYPDPAALSPETSEFLAKLPPLNIFRMLAGGEGLLRAFSRFGNHLLYKTALDPVLREIAIVRVGILSRAPYEVYQVPNGSRRDDARSAFHSHTSRFGGEARAGTTELERVGDVDGRLAPSGA